MSCEGQEKRPQKTQEAREHQGPPKLGEGPSRGLWRDRHLPTPQLPQAPRVQTARTEVRLRPPSVGWCAPAAPRRRALRGLNFLQVPAETRGALVPVQPLLPPLADVRAPCALPDLALSTRSRYRSSLDGPVTVDASLCRTGRSFRTAWAWLSPAVLMDAAVALCRSAGPVDGHVRSTLPPLIHSVTIYQVTPGAQGLGRAPA